MFSARPVLPAALLAAACGERSDGECAARRGDDPWADCVIALDPVPESDFGHDGLPEVVLGPPGGGLDVASLGCDGAITLSFAGTGIRDGPGLDLLVFENPFSADFPEPGEVSVSDDGERWWVFECDPVALVGCAGRTPTGPLDGLDPSDPGSTGGDAFDLADVGLSAARWLRIEDRSRAYWDARGESYCDPGQGGRGGFDLDAAAAVHG